MREQTHAHVLRDIRNMELAWGKECGGNFSRTSGEVKIGDNVVAMLRTRAGSCKR